MKTEEDEAFDEIARKQGMWGGGFMAKRAMAAHKLQEDRINYGTSWSQDGKRIDPISVYKEPEQEPVAWVNTGELQGLTLGHYSHVEIYTDESAGRTPLYTAPPQREWVELTDEDKSELAKAQHSWEDLCLAVESKLKEKNNGT